MSVKHTKESIQKELARIQGSVPKVYREGLFFEEYTAPAVVQVLEKALEGDAPEEKKAEWRVLLAEAKEKKITENPKRAAMIERWVQKEIKISVKAGRLPTKKEFKKLNLTYEK